MPIRSPLLIAACVVMLAGAAQAQSSGSPSGSGSAPAAKSGQAAKTGQASDVVHKEVDESGVIRKKKAGGQRVVTHAPVPDTKANRAAHGGPNSQAGRNTKPAGN